MSGSPSVSSVSSVVGNGLIVPKEKIAANGDYNLSGERYREGGRRQSRISAWSGSANVCKVRESADARVTCRTAVTYMVR